MKSSLIVAGIVALIAFGIFGVLYILDNNTDLDQKVDKEDNVITENTLPLLVTSNEEVFQGGALGFLVTGVDKEPLATWGGNKISLIPITRGYVGVVPVSLSEKTGTRELVVRLSEGEILTKEIIIVAKDYGQSELIVPKKAAEAGKTSSTLVSGISTDDNAKIKQATSATSPKAFFNEKFVYPLPRWVDVGRFGVSRVSGGTSIRHLGTDLESETGDPVFSINAGKVVLSEYLNNYGHTIILDHGLGIFSMYLHLSSREVEVGEMVSISEKIGEVGNTGLYSIEPHLHFSIRVSGNSLDPKAFIDNINKVF